MEKVILNFSQIKIDSAKEVGEKNASIGDMYNNFDKLGIKVPGGFVITVAALRYFLEYNDLDLRLQELVLKLEEEDYANISEISLKARKLIINAKVPKDLEDAITKVYENTFSQKDTAVAVRSSAIAEDTLAEKSTGLYESFLNIRGSIALMYAIKCCYASIYGENAIRYRKDKGLGHTDVLISIGIQQMVRSDLACAGIAFNGADNIIHIEGSWGLGQNFKANLVTPDQYQVFVESENNIILNTTTTKYLGSKSKMLVYNEIAAGTNSTYNTVTPGELREQFVLDDNEIKVVSNYLHTIKSHFSNNVYVEWAKDGIDKQIYIVQAQPKHNCLVLLH